MEVSRRCFAKQFAGLALMSLGGAQLAGCLGGGDSGTESPASSTPASPAPANTPSQAVSATQSQAATASTDAGAIQTSQNNAPIWQPAPSIELVEGVPAVISVRQFVRDPDNDSLVISLNSGQLLPGITFNPNNATLAYDGRPLGAQPGAPVVLQGITFSADDRNP